MGFLPDLTRGFCWNREFTHGTNPIPRAQLDLVREQFRCGGIKPALKPFTIYN